MNAIHNISARVNIPCITIVNKAKIQIECDSQQELNDEFNKQNYCQ